MRASYTGYIASAIVGTIMLATAAMAATGEYDNMCTMGLALGSDVATDCTVNAMIGGKTYCFGNQAAMNEFMLDTKGNLAKANSYYAGKH